MRKLAWALILVALFIGALGVLWLILPPVYVVHLDKAPDRPTLAPDPADRHPFTEGFWCRDVALYDSGVRSMTRECYQFYPDGTYATGFTHTSRGMVKSWNCATKTDCSSSKWTALPGDRYQVFEGTFTWYGDRIYLYPFDATFLWSPAGV